jgi:hypothetical protein
MNNKVKAFYEYNPLDVIYADMPKSMIEKYQQILPEFLIEIWNKDGLSSHKDGFFWMVNPDDYTEIINQFIPNNNSLHVLIRTAFGGLIYFDENAKINPKKDKYQYNYLCPIFLQVTPLTNNLDVVMNGWLTTEEVYISLMFYNIYKMGRKKLPRPQPDECFGFSPAIALGGDLYPDNIKLFKIKEHLLFLSQLK